MAYWVFRDEKGSVAIEGGSWLEALPEAVDALADGASWKRVLVAFREDDFGLVAGPDGRVCMTVQAYEGLLPDDALGSTTEPALGLPIALGRALVADLEEAGGVPEPPLPDAYAEKVFDATRVIADAADVGAAAEAALAVLRDWVPAEAGSVMYAGVAEEGFRFVAAFGPVAERVLGRVVPFGWGLAGKVHDEGVALLVHDLWRMARHLHYVDEDTGYRPTSLVVVPVRTDDGRSFGVLELLARQDLFQPWHVTLAEEVALALADRLAALG